MRVLLDECLPRKFKYGFPNHECSTVPEAGFAGLKNGRLLLAAEHAGFEIFLSIDKGLQYQQNLTGRRLAILVMRARSNRLKDLLPMVGECGLILEAIRPGEVFRVG